MAVNNNIASKFYGETESEDYPEIGTDYEQVLCKEITTTKSSGITDVASKVIKNAFMGLSPRLFYMVRDNRAIIDLEL